MKNRKMLLPVLLSIALIFSLILPAFVMAQGQVKPMVAAGSYHTMGLKSNNTVVAAGLEFEPAKWNLTKTINWPLIGGIIAAVVAAGLVIFFMRRRGKGPV